jgi:hypothetical protein
MAESRVAGRGTFARVGGRRRRRSTLARVGRSGRRGLGILLWAPLAIRLLGMAVVVAAVWLAVNWIYQVVRKPTELFFPVSGTLSKSPPETWRQYGPLFRRHSTAVMTPALLAALAQVEGAGNPVARTYWRWRLTWNPFELYQPASSAVGMYQITDATFQEARRHCVVANVAVERGCRFTGFYTRVVPGHAVEMTSALLDRTVAATLQRRRIARATLAQKQDLAAVIHLCGAGAGDAFARRGFRPTAGQRCGDHDVRRYLAQVHAVKRQFVRLAAAS